MRKRTSIIWKIPEMVFRELIEKSQNFADVLSKIGIKCTGGNYTTLKKRMREDKVDISHFRKNLPRKRPKMKLEDILVQNSTYARCSLKKRLLQEGVLKNQCYICGMNDKWNGKPLTLIIDHINGISDDNRIENLRIVCPACNSQLPTHCGRHKSKKYYFCNCGNKMYKTSKHCRRCKDERQIGKTKITWPSYQDLIYQVNSTNLTQVGKSLGVSANAVKKRLKKKYNNWKSNYHARIKSKD